MALALALGSTALAPAQAAQVASPNQALLENAISAGGTVTFAFSDTIVLTNTIAVTQDVVLDGTGRSVVISGGGAFRMFQIAPGTHVAMTNLVFANGQVTGTAGAEFINPGEGKGGFLYNEGTLTLAHCQITNCTAIGGTANSMFLGFFIGGAGSGGAIYNQGGHVEIHDCVFRSNSAVGGPNVNAGAYGSSGQGRGGALYSNGGLLLAQNTSFDANAAHGGPPSSTSGSGFALGGAVCATAAEVHLVNCRLASNQAVSEKRMSLSSPATGTALAGALYQSGGTLSLTGCYAVSNSASGGPFNGAAYGGFASISNTVAAVEQSAFDSNLALGGISDTTGKGNAAGGAFYNDSTLSVTNCTFYRNAATGGDSDVSLTSGDGLGGAVFNNSANTLSVFHATLSQNEAHAGYTSRAQWLGAENGGGIFNNGGTVSVKNSILASNYPNDSYGTITDDGHNLVSDTSAGWSSATTLTSVNPLLGPLGTFGGSIPVLPITTSSPALDAAENGVSPADQRGRARPFGSAADIGAFESSPPYFVSIAMNGYHSALPLSFQSSGGSYQQQPDGSCLFLGFSAGVYSIRPQSPDSVFQPNALQLTVNSDVFASLMSYRSNALHFVADSNGVTTMVFAGAPSSSWTLERCAVPPAWITGQSFTVGTNGLTELPLLIPGFDWQLYRARQP